MKVLKNKRSGHTVSLEIETSLDLLKVCIDDAFKHIVKDAKVPGFRKGKVPRAIFEKHYGTSMLLQEGVTEVVNRTYSLALKELELDVVDYPKNLNVEKYEEGVPVKFTCEVDVKPEIKLGKYKGIKAKKKSTDIDESKIDEQINQLREHYAEFTDVERASQNDDLVKLNMKASINDEPFAAWTRQGMSVKIGMGQYSEAFDKEITGLKKGESKSFDVTYANDYQTSEVQGKAVNFELELIEVQEKHLPVLDDPFAAKVSPYKTVTELKDNIKKNMQDQITKESDEQLKSSLIETIVNDSKMEIPEGMINFEIDNDIKQYESQLAQSKSSIDHYLKMINQSMDQFRETLKGDAVKRIQGELVIDALIKSENIEVSDDDVKAEIQKLVPTADTDEKVAEEMKRINLEGFKNLIQKRKAVEFVEEKAKIEIEK
jgi:trigger factor